MAGMWGVHGLWPCIWSWTSCYMQCSSRHIQGFQTHSKSTRAVLYIQRDVTHTLESVTCFGCNLAAEIFLLQSEGFLNCQPLGCGLKCTPMPALSNDLQRNLSLSPAPKLRALPLQLIAPHIAMFQLGKQSDAAHSNLHQ